MTLAAYARPVDRNRALLYDATLIIGGSILIALSAQIRFLLPFSPVPITGQTFAVLFVGALFGANRGAATVLAYLAQGFAGLPVFAGGMSGAVYFAGPTGGYLAGFVIAAYVVGLAADRGWMRNALHVAVAMVAGNLAIYGFGALWLSAYTGFPQALAAGVTPFLAGDVVKIAVAMIVLPVAHRMLGSR